MKLTAQIWANGICIKTIQRKGNPVSYRELPDAIALLKRTKE